MSLLRRIFEYIWPEARKHWISFFLVFFGYGVAILFDNIIKPFIYKEIVDSITSGLEADIILAKITHLAVLYVLVMVVYFSAYRVGDYANAHFESKVMKRLYDLTFNKLLHHSYTFFSNNFSGSIVAKVKRFSKSFEVIQDTLSFQLWFVFITLTGVLVVLFTQLPVFGFVFLIWAIFYVFITFLFLKKKVKLDLQKSAADSLVTAELSDTITNILNVKIFSGNLREEKHFKKITAEEEEKRRRSWFFGNFQGLIQGALMSVLQIAVIFLTIKLWYMGEMSVGDFVLLQAYMFSIFDILWNLGRSLTRALEALSDMKEMVDILDLPPEIKDPLHPEKCLINKGEITFKNVSFEYVENQDVFSNFNLKIKNGEKIGLVGHSGSGKSTIVKILLRFTDVKKGEVLIDGQNITKLKQADLRNKISYVPQDPILFHRSIKENIAYSKPEAEEEEILIAAKKSQAHEFILKLPKGYDTLVGERGIKLSGGERQRVALTRAMLKNAPIVVLDEATSSLDSISEAYIQTALVELLKEKSAIVIAHRLSTIQKMDRILVLEKGEIVEDGTHQELLDKNGFYANLWNHQTGGFLN